MKFLKSRFLPFLLILSVLSSVSVSPAFASDFPDGFRDYDAVEDWNAQLLVTGNAGIAFLSGLFGVSASSSDVFWALVNNQLGSCNGPQSRGELVAISERFNTFFNRTLGETFFDQIESGTQEIASDVLARILIGEWEPHFIVVEHPVSGLLRIQETQTGLFIVDSAGRYPYVDLAENNGLGSDRWVPFHYMNQNSYRMLNQETLYNLADDVDGRVTTSGEYLVISQKPVSSISDQMILANQDGKPYVAWNNKNQSATSQDRPTTNVTENGDIIEGDFTDNSFNLDLEGMTFNLADGTLAFIDKLVYDASTKSYHIDSHDTYNYEINNYYTWNYYINYTSVTYIGQTEEYNKYYEVYYELPDGRDSADLTKEDLEQLNLSIDVIPYIRSADDTSLRSLYHFDGDTKDASYWNYCTEFIWNKGASLTYMDASAFGGALYLDETEHDFTMVLPSSIGTNDFTLQFRYYQSATLAPQRDSFVYFGDTAFLSFDGSAMYNGSGSINFGVLPTGTWNEICLMRKDSQYCYYLNGVPLKSGPWSLSFSNTVRFSFGNKQQTFKYLDEFRFVDEGLYTVGQNYTPSAVPHDTNLTLVLPDSQVPVADEYWSFENPTQTNLLTQYDLDEWAGFSRSSYLNQCNTLTSSDSYGYITAPYMVGSSRYDFPRFSYYSNLTNFDVSQAGLKMTFNASNGLISNPDYACIGNQYYAGGPTGGLFSAVGASSFNTASSGFMYPDSDTTLNSPLAKGDYTFSLVNENGDVESVTFNFDVGSSFKAPQKALDYSRCVEAFGYRFGLALGGGWSHYPYLMYFLVVQPVSSSPDTIVYMELVSGSSSDLSAEWVESVVAFDKDSVDRPTLAVRTDIDITSYQIGGVRPSVPTKGQVWALVENERITSIQIYNGQAWEGVDGRIWTGSRWIPASSYNIVTLQDMYDIVDATQDFEYIYSESGFWTWWQKSWNAFTEKLFAVLGSGGGSGASGGLGSSELQKVDLDAEDPASDPDQEDGKTLWQFIVLVVNGSKSVVGGVRHLFSGVVSTIPDTMDSITGAFDPGGVAVGIIDGTGADPDVSVQTYSDAEGEVLDPWRYR